MSEDQAKYIVNNNIENLKYIFGAVHKHASNDNAHMQHNGESNKSMGREKNGTEQTNLWYMKFSGQ